MWTEGTIRVVGDAREYYKIGDKPRGHRDFVMSRSELVKFSQCPEKWVLGTPSEESPSLRFGDLLDCFLIGGSSFRDRVFVAPYKYTTHRKVCPSCGSEGTGKTCRECKVERQEQSVEKEWNMQSDHCKAIAQQAIDEGKIVVKQLEFEQLEIAAKRFTEAKGGWLQRFLEDSQTQVIVQSNWVDSENGITVPFKVMLDFMPDPTWEFRDLLGDLKTTASADYDSWRMSCWKYRYHWQSALYLDVVNAVERTNRSRFVHLIGENTEPFVWTYREMSQEFLDIGRRQYRAALDRYCSHLLKREWEGYDCIPTEPLDWMKNL